MFFSLAVGMFCSAICRDERKAMLLAFAVLFFFVAGFPILAGILEDGPITRRVDLWKYLLVPSPGYASVMAFDAAARGAAKWNFFPYSVAFTHVLSWLLLVAASVIVPRTWQEKAASPGNKRLQQIDLGAPQQRRNHRRQLLDLNPICWLIARHRMRTVAVWLFLGVVGFIWLIGLSANARDWKDESAFIWTALIVHTVLKFWIASEATRRFSSDRQSGALELLLSTPLPVPSIVRGQTMALERQFALPIGLVLLADFIFLLSSRSDSTLVILWIALMVVLVADVVTLSWVGMWRGLNSRHPNRAAAATLLLVLVLPWALFLMFMTFVGVSGIARDIFIGRWTCIRKSPSNSACSWCSRHPSTRPTAPRASRSGGQACAMV
jgi:ABC-type transport system involved in cytochrome c biogenesis permease component